VATAENAHGRQTARIGELTSRLAECERGRDEARAGLKKLADEVEGLLAERGEVSRLRAIEAAAKEWMVWNNRDEWHVWPKNHIDEMFDAILAGKGPAGGEG
jgi:hypothetical protein